MRKHSLYVLLVCLATLSACAAPTTPSPALSTSSPAASPDASGSVPSPSSAGSTPAAPPPASTAATTSPTGSELDGTAWTLQTLNGTPVITDTTITLAFDDDQASGLAGCNGYGGQYTATNDGALTFSNVASTLIGCEDPAITEQERAYLDTLYTVVGYSLNDERLELQDAAGTTTLIFAPQAQEDASPTSTETAEATAVTSPDLDGSAWVLQKLQNKDLIESTNITLEFDGERASGYAGCNGYGGTYNAGDNSLSLGDITATQRGCLAPEGVMEQESTYLETLTEIATYTLNGANLEITNAAGDTLLTFAPKERFAMNPGDLVGTQWRLRSFNGQDLPADTQYTLSFTSDRDASGSTGCRQYTAAYAAEGDSLRFPSTEMTAIDCMRPRSQGQEIDFLSGFTFGVQYRLSADQLEMFPVEGGTLVWEPLREDASTTQEATVWTLQGFAEGETTTPVPNGTTITLSFDEDTMGEQGTVSGSAGCNTYSADYTYAETLTISSPVTTRIACEPAAMEQEQRFLDLLQNVRTYNLEEQLLLQTEDGRGLLFAAQ